MSGTCHLLNNRTNNSASVSFGAAAMLNLRVGRSNQTVLPHCQASSAERWKIAKVLPDLGFPETLPSEALGTCEAPSVLMVLSPRKLQPKKRRRDNQPTDMTTGATSVAPDGCWIAQASERMNDPHPTTGARSAEKNKTQWSTCGHSDRCHQPSTGWVPSHFCQPAHSSQKRKHQPWQVGRECRCLGSRIGWQKTQQSTYEKNGGRHQQCPTNLDLFLRAAVPPRLAVSTINNWKLLRIQEIQFLTVYTSKRCAFLWPLMEELHWPAHSLIIKLIYTTLLHFCQSIWLPRRRHSLTTCLPRLWCAPCACWVSILTSLSL